MIHYLVTEAGRFGIEKSYLDDYGSDMKGRFRVVTYEQLADLRSIPVGTWVFSAVDQLGEAAIELATRVWDRLESVGDRTRLLNHPGRVLRRHELLATLERNGINRFMALEPEAALSGDSGLRYPVFVREKNRHTGSLTNLLDSRRELRGALNRLRLRGFRRADMLVVEYYDTSSPDGIFRKYSAFRVGDEVAAKSIICSPDWVTKANCGDWTDEMMCEERRYVIENPHAEQLREIFELANVDFGRIDYAVDGDRIQVWEINTNPTIGHVNGLPVRPEHVVRMRWPGKRVFYKRFREAWDVVDRPAVSEIPFEPAPELIGRVEAERRARARIEMRQRLIVKIARGPARLTRRARHNAKHRRTHPSLGNGDRR